MLRRDGAVGRDEGQGPAARPLPEEDREGGRVEAEEGGAGSVDDGHERQAELTGQAHPPPASRRATGWS